MKNLDLGLNYSLRKLHLMLFSDQLKRIDLSGNQISKVNEDAFRSMLQLQDLTLADNNIQALPELPANLKHIDVRNNQLRSSGMHTDAFMVCTQPFNSLG